MSGTKPPLDELERAYLASHSPADATRWARALRYRSDRLDELFQASIQDMTLYPLRRTDELSIATLTESSLLGDMAIVSSAQRYWQYYCRNLLWLEYDGFYYLYLPPRQDPGDPSTITLYALPGYLWPERAVIGDSDYDRWTRFARSHYSPQELADNLPEWQAVIRADFLPEIANALRRCLHRDSPLQRRRAGFALIDLLLRYRGEGSAELSPCEVFFDLGPIRALVGSWNDDGMPEEAYHHHVTGEIRGVRGERVYLSASAYTYKSQAVDGEVGGRYREVARVSFTETAHGVRLRRVRLWEERIHGDPMT